jgi:hypothetical protein
MQAGNGNVLLPFRGNFERGYKQILEIVPQKKEVRRWATPLSSAPGWAIPIGPYYWVSFDHIIKPNDAIKKSRQEGLSDYQESGFEVYSSSPNIQLMSILRLGEFDHMYELTWSPGKKTMFALVGTFAMRDANNKRQFFDPWRSSIYEIDTTSRKIVRKQDISSYAEDATGIQYLNGKLYVSAIRDPHKKTGKYERPNNKLFVLDAATLQLKKTLDVDYFPRKVGASAEDGRIFVLHKGVRGSSASAITVIDANLDKIESRIDIEGIDDMFLPGGQRLFVVTKNQLLVLDTKTLTLVKTFAGKYVSVAGPL